MRISDWSSDVCSSDLESTARCRRGRVVGAAGVSGRTSWRGVVVMPTTLDFDTNVNVNQIGRASCRESVCQYVLISVVAGSSKQKHEPSSFYDTDLTTTSSTRIIYRHIVRD